MRTDEEINDLVTLLGEAVIKKVATTELRSNGGPNFVEYGCHYVIVEGCDIALPSGRENTDGYIHFSKISGLTDPVVIGITAANEGDLIRVGVNTDDSILYDVDRPITLFWQSGNQVWVV